MFSNAVGKVFCFAYGLHSLVLFLLFFFCLFVCLIVFFLVDAAPALPTLLDNFNAFDIDENMVIEAATASDLMNSDVIEQTNTQGTFFFLIR